MATYNGAAHISEQLDSIVRQSPRPLEILIGDDGSSDATVAIIERFARQCDVPIHLHRNDHRLGYGENFLQTASRAHGELIAFADQDDIWLSGRLAAATAAFSDPSLTLWICNWKVVDDYLAAVPDRRVHTGFVQSSVLAYPLHVAHGSRMVFRGSLIDHLPADGRPISVMGGKSATHDEWAGYAAHALGRVHQHREVLMLYRRHSNAVSAEEPDIPPRRWLLARGGEPSHADLAAAARQRALHLRERAQAAEVVEIRAKLLDSATYYDAIGPRLARRARTHNGLRRRDRAARLLAAIAHGDHRPLARGGLGLWMLAQDCYAVLAVEVPTAPSGNT